MYKLVHRCASEKLKPRRFKKRSMKVNGEMEGSKEGYEGFRVTSSY